jgi:hypothetical protein
MTASDRLTYVLNHYSEDGASHFAHVLGLIQELAKQGVSVRLIIEKGDRPRQLDDRVEVVVLKPSSRAARLVNLYREVKRSQRLGYDTVFVRIAVWSALVSILATRGGRGRVFFWQSGTTIEFDGGSAPQYLGAWFGNFVTRLSRVPNRC